LKIQMLLTLQAKSHFDFGPEIFIKPPAGQSDWPISHTDPMSDNL